MSEQETAKAVLMSKEANKVKATEEPQSNPIQSVSNLPKDVADAITKDVLLPSKGVYYNGLVKDGKLKIRMLKVSDTKLIYNDAIPHYERINKLIERCILDFNMPISEMVISDKFYLLIQVRSLSYGNIYKYKLTCPQCRAVNNVEKDLNELEVSSVEDIQKRYPFVLPIAKRKVFIKHMTVADEASSNSYLNNVKLRASRENKKVGDEELIAYTLACQIEEIEGVGSDTGPKLEYINNMVNLDYEALQKFIKSKEFGVNMDLIHNCTKCGQDIEYQLPFDIEFFRPRL